MRRITFFVRVSFASTASGSSVHVFGTWRAPGEKWPDLPPGSPVSSFTADLGSSAAADALLGSVIAVCNNAITQCSRPLKER